MSKAYNFLSEQAGVRIDSFLADVLDGEFTRSAIAELIGKGFCEVNGCVVSKNYKIKLSDKVEFKVPNPQNVEIKAENIPLEIVFEDDFLLVVNKPKGMVVHPAVGHCDGTLVNALMYHCGDSLSGINGEIRPGIVHRIDKDTSGLLVVAKNDVAHNFLAAQIKEHSFVREYEAIVLGSIKQDGTINAPIGRHKIDRKKMCVTEQNSREAVTHYHVVENFGNYTHLRLKLETGRTHQIRVHLSYIGFPIVGDEVYGNGKPKWLSGQCLHAKRLGFIHPKGEFIEFSSPLPEYFVKMLNFVK